MRILSFVFLSSRLLEIASRRTHMCFTRDIKFLVKVLTRVSLQLKIVLCEYEKNKVSCLARIAYRGIKGVKIKVQY